MPRVASLKFINESDRKCKVCGLVVAYRHDLSRHMRLHEVGKTEGKYQCSWVGCSYVSLQKTNLDTHYRIHTQDKSKACPDCDFRTCDPASLTRHRKRLHNYVPRPRKARASNKQEVHFAESSEVANPPSPTSSNSNTEFILDLSSPPSFDINPPVIGEPVVIPSFLDGTPPNLDDLFFEPDFVCHRRRLPEPRPLFPAVESSPPLQKFGEFHFDYSSEFEFPMLLGSQQTAVLPHIDTLEAGLVALQGHSEFPDLQPYDFALELMAELDPSISVTVPECDFRNIFGLDCDTSLDQWAATPMSPWSNLSSSSGSASPLLSPLSSDSSSPPLFTGSLLAELYTPLDF